MAPPFPYRPSDAADPLAPVVPPPELSDRWYELRLRLGRSPFLAAAMLGGGVLVALSGWWLLRPPPPALETALPRAETAARAALAERSGTDPASTGGPGGAERAGTVTSTGAVDGHNASAPGSLVVQASGSVIRPGVYRLTPGARVDDLVRAAGGLGPDADADRVNLAAPVVDGERVWLPRRGEGDPPALVAGGGSAASVGDGSGPGSGSGAGSGPASPVDLNTASADQLDTLPGVGPATAAAILAYRDAHGPFGAIEELLDVRGIGDAKLEQLRPLVTT